LRADPRHPNVYGRGIADIPDWGIEPQFNVDDLKRAI